MNDFFFLVRQINDDDDEGLKLKASGLDLFTMKKQTFIMA